MPCDSDISALSARAVNKVGAPVLSMLWNSSSRDQAAAISGSVSGFTAARRTRSPRKRAWSMGSTPQAGRRAGLPLLPFRAQQPVMEHIPAPEIALHGLAHAHFQLEPVPLDEAHGAGGVFKGDGRQPEQPQFLTGILQKQTGRLAAIALAA